MCDHTHTHTFVWITVYINRDTNTLPCTERYSAETGKRKGQCPVKISLCLTHTETLGNSPLSDLYPCLVPLEATENKLWGPVANPDHSVSPQRAWSEPSRDLTSTDSQNLILLGIWLAFTHTKISFSLWKHTLQTGVQGRNMAAAVINAKSCVHNCQ